jgi:hypothetical protein
MIGDPIRWRGEHRLQQLIDALFSFVGLCTPDGTLVEANQTIVEAGGLRLADVIGEKIWRTPWVSWDDGAARQVQESVVRGQGGRPSRFDLEIRLATGNVIVDFQLMPVVEDGEVVALVPSATDVTARRRSVEQATGLATLARRLNGASTSAEVVEAIRQHASGAVGSRFASVGLLDDDGATVSLLHAPALPESLAARYGVLPIDSPIGAVRSVREGRTVVMSDPVGPADVGGDAELAGRLARDRTAAGVGVTVAAPLKASDGRSFGALSMGWPTPADLDGELTSRVETVAELCAQSFERVRLHAAEHELVAGLQRRFLRPLPVVDGLDVHATYRTARSSVGIGGDFYDAMLLREGCIAIVVGDVAGHGMEAAADMAQLRTVLSTLLAAGAPLERLFSRTEQVLEQVAAASLATAVVAVVDLPAGTLTYVHAGHPPLVLASPEGGVRTLDAGRGPLLGLRGLHLASRSDVQAEPATVPFPPGSVLVAYTDGLVETRGESIDDGIQRVIDATAHWCGRGRPRTPSAAAVSAAVLDSCIGERSLTDDVALVVVTRP